MPTIYRFSLAPPDTTLGPTADGSASVSAAVAIVRAFSVDVRPQPGHLTFATIDTGSSGFGTVSGLAVTGVTETSVTVQWTQVQDDQGNPAKYVIRVRSPTIDADTWGNYVTTAYVDTDLAVGVTKTHTFINLLPGTDYGVMLIPFRGPSGDADAFGVFSNVATGTTDAGTQLGTITDLAAFGGDGQAVLTWSAAANATSHQPQYKLQTSGTWLNFGTALGGSANTVTVTGLENGSTYDFRVVAGNGAATTNSNTASATPNEILGGLWPNKPAGLSEVSTFTLAGETQRTLSAFVSPFAGDWTYLQRNNVCEVVTDTSAPSGNGKAFRMVYPSGNFEGEPGIAYRTFGGNTTGKTVYFGFIIKHDSWTEHPVGSKTGFLFYSLNDATSQFYMGGAPGRAPGYAPEFDGSDPAFLSGGSAPSNGVWYMYEFLVVNAAGSIPGNSQSVKMWRTPWTGSAWGSTTQLRNDTRTTTDAKEEFWDHAELSGTWGGGFAVIGSEQYLSWDLATVWHN